TTGAADGPFQSNSFRMSDPVWSSSQPMAAFRPRPTTGPGVAHATAISTSTATRNSRESRPAQQDSSASVAATAPAANATNTLRSSGPTRTSLLQVAEDFSAGHM